MGRTRFPVPFQTAFFRVGGDGADAVLSSADVEAFHTVAHGTEADAQAFGGLRAVAFGLFEGLFDDVAFDLVEIVLYLHGIGVERAATQGFLCLIGIAEGGDDSNRRIEQAAVDVLDDF